MAPLGNPDPLLLSQATPYQIEQSLRFDGSSGFTRTHSNNNASSDFTLSMWFKKSYNGENNMMLLHTNTDPRYSYVSFGESSGDADLLTARGTASGYAFNTSRKYRDPSAWYHLVLSVDAGTLTKGYINGVLDQNTGATSGWYLNGTDPLGLGRTAAGGNYFNGYMAEVHFIDGQALDADSFGEFDNGVWRPKRYTGSYGTNGFYLKFDSSATNGIGHDHSGNGNNWTASGFTTSGIGTDVMSDTPTTNWCTLNPLSNQVHTLSNGNIDIASAAGNADTRCNSTIAVSSGKWYYEVTLTDAGTNSAAGIGQNQITNAWPGNDSLSYAYGFENAVKANNGSSSSYGSALGAGDVFMCAFDLDNNKIFFGKNGTWFDSSDPAAGTNSAYTLATGVYCPVFRPYELNSIGASFSCNFGQRDFAYTPPTGFKALNTSNLPAPTVKDGSDYFNTVTYTGSVTDTSTQAVTGVGFQSDWTWIKRRDNANSHQLVDVVRGTGKWLESNSANAEDSTNTNGVLTSFDSDGFTLTGGSTNANLCCESGNTYVAWNWLAGGTGSSNTAGTITSTVSANPSAGFSIVSYTGTGTAGTVGHGLGVAPKMVIVKDRDNANFWVVGHQDLGGTGFAGDYYIRLNEAFAGEVGGGVAWNSTNPTSTVFSIGTSTVLNGIGNDHIAYCFAEVEGYSKFGSYTGSTGLPFVWCGFRPKWVLIKNSNSATDWHLFDTARDPSNEVTQALYPDTAGSEDTLTNNEIDILSNGFKLRSTGSSTNGSGNTLIFAAFAEHPTGGSGVSPATAR